MKGTEDGASGDGDCAMGEDEMSYLNSIAGFATATFASCDVWLESLHPHMVGIDSAQLALIGAASFVGSRFMTQGRP